MTKHWYHVATTDLDEKKQLTTWLRRHGYTYEVKRFKPEWYVCVLLDADEEQTFDAFLEEVTAQWRNGRK